MKRMIAAVVLLAALGVLCKLAWKERPGAGSVAADSAPSATGPVAGDTPTVDEDAAFLARYTGPDRALAERVLRDYHHNALAIEKSDGRRGLMLLDRLGLEAVFLYEKYPTEFRRLRDSLTDDAAADLLLHWREYFALKQADEVDRGLLVSEIASLKPAQRRAAAAFPHALPLILTEPVGMTELINHLRSRPDDLRDALVMLDLISLEPGAADLRAALRVLDAYGDLALDAFRRQGPEGFALVKLYGPILEALGSDIELDDSLILLRVNTDDVDRMLSTTSPEAVAGYLRHVAGAGLTEPVGSSPHGLRLTVEFGPVGDRALKAAGAEAADVVYEDVPDRPMLRGQAVAALAEHGPMALAMLSKYAADPQFLDILTRYGPRVITPIAQADPAPEALAALRRKPERTFKEAIAVGVLAMTSENGQAVIRQIAQDGPERVEELRSDDVAFYQFLPLYDIMHLGRVVTRGHTPTRGEMAWAVVDGAFIVADVLSLAVLQPGGAVASETARAEVKALGREAAERSGRELAEQAVEAGTRAAARDAGQVSTERLARWWTVRLAGGTYRVLRHLPDALPKLALSDLARMSRPLAEKAGLRLSTWAPVRFVQKGVTIIQAIPPERGLKYIGAQVLQASVGVVGIRKMEEHLASRRPEPDAPVAP
jgi:hypothetical protein